jgi:hypothetical protein
MIQLRSRAAWAAAMYSASALESATVGCFELTQWMGAPGRVNTLPVVVQWRARFSLECLVYWELVNLTVSNGGIYTS